MSAQDRSRCFAVLLSLVPGWGHVYLGREARGLVLFTVFAIGGFGLLNGLLLYIGWGRSFVLAASGFTALAVWVWACVDIIRLTSPVRRHAEEEDRLKALREGTVRYLRGDLEDAKRAFGRCLKKDPGDVEALFRLGILCARSGDSRGARTYLRRASKLDLDGKWVWEIQRELARLAREEEAKEPASRAARAHPSLEAEHATGSRP